MTFFKNNWLKFHYNLDPDQTQRSSHWDVFSYSSSAGDLLCKNFIQEMDNTCTDLHTTIKNKGKDAAIFLSGGVDSEIIARTFVKLGLDFEPFFIRFADGLNLHEKHYVDIFAKQTGKKVNYIDVDLYKWCDHDLGFKNYMKTYHTWDLATPLQIWAREQIPKSFSVISGNYEPHLFKWQLDESLKLEWAHFFEESPFMARMKHCMDKEFNDYPFFYLYRPELYAAYSMDPIVMKMIENPFKLSLASTKKLMMEYYFPEMPVRNKFTGFEKVQPTWRTVFDEICKDFGYIDGSFAVPHSKINTLFNYA